jgi:hypothetical protein
VDVLNEGILTLLNFQLAKDGAAARRADNVVAS